jgi:hypothetical protein
MKLPIVISKNGQFPTEASWQCGFIVGTVNRTEFIVLDPGINYAFLIKKLREYMKENKLIGRKAVVCGGGVMDYTKAHDIESLRVYYSFPQAMYHATIVSSILKKLYANNKEIEIYVRPSKPVMKQIVMAAE